MRTSATLCLLLLTSLGCCHAARILAVVPTPSVSHQMPLRSILLALAARGHHITSITTDPMEEPPENYTQVDLSFTYDFWRLEFDFAKMTKESAISLLVKFIEATHVISDTQLNSTAMQQFIKQDHRFDLMIIEKLPQAAYYGLAHKVGSPPLVGYVSFGAMPHMRHTFGSTINPAYIPDFNTGYSDHLTFFQRVYSVYHTLCTLYLINTRLYPLHEQTAKKYFGDATLPVKETDYNFSLLLTNNHFSLSYPVPNPPNVIELTGIHIEKERKPYPQAIKEFLDGAEHGVVYMSLGSNVKSTNMPMEKLTAFLKAFAQIPQRVLWKFETDELPGKPANVMTSKWVPQQDVLAHPNVKLFITQGGLQSFNEAAYFGVPLIGVPFFGDQHYNVEKMVAAGIGQRVNYEDIAADTLLCSLQTVLYNESFRQNMARFSAVYREHQATSMERAVWWIEYVIRHKGAPHLRSAAMDLRWWQLLLLDVLGFVVAATGVSCFLLYKGLRCAAGALARKSKLKTG